LQGTTDRGRCTARRSARAAAARMRARRRLLEKGHRPMREAREKKKGPGGRGTPKSADEISFLATNANYAGPSPSTKGLESNKQPQVLALRRHFLQSTSSYLSP